MLTGRIYIAKATQFDPRAGVASEEAPWFLVPHEALQPLPTGDAERARPHLARRRVAGCTALCRNGSWTWLGARP